jgi:hypothetical protein
MATFSCVVGPLARVHVTMVEELKTYTEEAAKAIAIQHLTSSECATWIEMQANTTRKMEWLLGRVALKEAVCDFMLETQLTTIHSKDLVISRS